MIAIISLIVVLVLSLLVVRVATVALTLTGLSKELARFQARSAFTGSGFTTSESEKVVHHPIRRRIIMLLMLLGNAGIITAVSSLILSFVNTESQEGWQGNFWVRMGILIFSLALLWTLASSEWVDRWLSGYIAYALKKWTKLELRDYAGLLHLSHGYKVAELQVESRDWLAHKTLLESRLNHEGVLVLGIEKPDGTFLGTPRGNTRIMPEDTILLYGRSSVIADLDNRRADWSGQKAHEAAKEEQRQIEQQEEEIEKEIEEKEEKHVLKEE